MKPHVIVIAGPNGAGKSTAAPVILRDDLGLTDYVNVDLIAQGLSAFASETFDPGEPTVNAITRPDIDQLLKDSRQMDAMLRRAVIQAIQMHKRAGNPIAVWREGKVVWLSPEEIPDAPDECP